MRVIKPQVFNPYEFSRPSPATYYNAAGLLLTAGNDQLRLGYDPTTLDFIGPILEGESENVLLRSDDFSNAAWTKSLGASITPNAAISIDGTMNAALYDGDGFVSQSLSLSGDYIFSLFVKPVSPTNYPAPVSIRLNISPLDTRTVEFFFYADHAPATNFSPGAFGGIQVLQNGWYRIWSRSLDPEGASVSGVGISSSGSDQFYISKAQLEPGYVMTSYITTTSATATRAADFVVNQSPSVIESNIEENDAPVWSSGASYVANNLVMVLGQYHRVYKSTGNNTNKFPPDNPTDWIDTGATNRWRMFDMRVGADKQSVANESGGDIRFLLAIDDPVDSITLLNVDASSVQIIVRDSGGNVVYDYFQETLTFPDAPFWWGFFFGNRRRVVTIIRVDLPPYFPVTIEVIATGDASPARIGKTIVGDAVLIGCARYGTGVGIIDFSRKEQDAFGNYYVLERRFIGRCNYDIQVDTDQVDSVQALLADVRATPCVYVGSTKFKSTVVFGFYRDFDIVIAGPRKSACSLQVQGI